MTVNHGVPGSSPGEGAIENNQQVLKRFKILNINVLNLFFVIEIIGIRADSC